MTRFLIPRGIAVAAIGVFLLALGSTIFDSSYDKVESVMPAKHYLVEDKTISQDQYLNSTFAWNQLADHSVLIVNSSPSSDTLKLQVSEPGNQTFEKESKDGYVYHIIGKNPQNQGTYSFKIYNLGSEPATVNVVLGEDPYLSGKCTSNDAISCYAIPVAIGIVIAGMLALIIGSAIAVTDFRKKKKKPNTR